jgi:hypothetical protein
MRASQFIAAQELTASVGAKTVPFQPLAVTVLYMPPAFSASTKMLFFVGSALNTAPRSAEHAVADFVRAFAAAPAS